MRYVREDPPEIGQRVIFYLSDLVRREGVFEGTEMKDRIYGRFRTNDGTVMYSNLWEALDES